MKFCPKCGTQNEDKAGFCTNCGDRFVQQSGVYNQFNQYDSQPQLSFSQSLAYNPVIRLIRQTGTSSLFISAAVLLSLSVLIGFISAFVPLSEDFIAGLNSSLSSYGEDIDIFGNLINVFNQMKVFIGLVSSVGPAIICIAMWILYAECKDESSGIIKTTGFSMIKVISMINFILGCIAMGGLILFLLLMIAAVNIAGNTTSLISDDTISIGFMNFIYGTIFVVLIAVAIMMVIYYIKLLSAIKLITSSVETGKPETKLSTFIAVYNFLNAAALLILVFSADNLSRLSYAINAAFFVVISIVFISYKDKIKNLAMKMQHESDNYYNNYNNPPPNNYLPYNPQNPPPTEQQQSPFVPPQE